MKHESEVEAFSINGSEAQDCRVFMRKAVLMSIAIQATVDLDAEDPARFNSEIFDSLLPALASDMSRFLAQAYPKDTFSPNRLMKFINDDALLNSWIEGRREGNRSAIQLSEEGVAEMERTYSAIHASKKTQDDAPLDVSRDMALLEQIIQQTAPRKGE